MIPLKIHRVLLVLFAVSATLALADVAMIALGMPPSISGLVAGALAGLLVFTLAYHGGRVLMFCGKGLKDEPVRRSRIREVLLDIGVIEERRTGQRRRQGRAALAKAAEQVRSADDRRRYGGPPPGKQLMYVSVVESKRFIAITVRSGNTHRAFISTRMVDALTPAALRGVLAHEYGHVDNNHPLKQATILGVVASVKFMLGLPLPVALVVLLSYLAMLRSWEFVADRAAALRTSSKDVLAAFDEYKLIEGDSDLSTLSEIFSGHPSFFRRSAAINALSCVPSVDAGKA